MKEKILEILYNHFGWQRKESIEKSASEIETVIAERYVDKEFVRWLYYDYPELYELKDKALADLKRWWKMNIKDDILMDNKTYE